MKAAVLRAAASLESLALVELPDPGAPGPGEARVRLHASSLNYHDYGVVTGKLPSSPGRIPLADGAGVVEAVGPGVTDLAVGDAVMSRFFPSWLDGRPAVADFSTSPGDGQDGYAREVAVCPATWFTRAPRGLSHLEAATLPVAALTAWRALVVDGQLQAGDTVLVLGSGGVSVAALQLAKAMGATVIATSSSPAKLGRLRDLGADHVIDHRATPHWAAQVLALTAGRGVDHVVEVGGPGTLAQSIEAVRVGGHIAMLGILTGFQGEVPVAALTMKQARLVGAVVGSRTHQLDLVRAIEAARIKPVIDRVFPLHRLAEAFRYQASGAHLGKIAIEI